MIKAQGEISILDRQCHDLSLQWDIRVLLQA